MTTSDSIPSVAIIGAGMSGLTAALRLLQRGFDVTVFERGEYIGGQFGVQGNEQEQRALLAKRGREDLHEHCYHMFLNWYHNFWDIAEELGVLGNFEPHHSIYHVRAGEWPRTHNLTDVGSPAHFTQNLCSGLLPIPDMYLYAYSLTDLLSQPFARETFSDQFSINGFMRSRPYMTEKAAEQHQVVMAKAFACPTYRTSAASYKSFMRYGFREPSPMMWMLNDNCHAAFLQPFAEHIEQLSESLTGVSRPRTHPCIRNRVDVVRLQVEEDRIGLACANVTDCETQEDPEPCGQDESLEYFDYVISAVSPDRLAKLLDQSAQDSTFFSAAEELFDVKQLHGEAIASFDLYFKRRLSDVPAGIIVLLNAKYDLTAVDNSQLWSSFDEDVTFLNVVASKFENLSGLPVAEAKRLIVEELARFIPFDTVHDVDWDRSFIRRNSGEHIFINDVGSWKYRPESTCGIDRLFMAGDFCKTFVDVTTLEGATVSGLNAVNALCSRAGRGEPVSIKVPDHYPEGVMLALKLWGAPAAMGAKMWSEASSRISDVMGMRS